MLEAGFHRVQMAGYTGFKSSPYTEGALFYGEKPAEGQARETLAPQTIELAEPLKEVACDPGGT
jgi:hypothetical protein